MVRTLRGAVAASIVLAWLVPSTPSEARAYKCSGEKATVVGTPGDDVIEAGTDNDVIAGLGGNDVIRGGKGRDVICGGRGNDRIFTEGWQGSPDEKHESAYGNRGDDKIVGGGESAGLWGGRGHDVLRSGISSPGQRGEGDVLTGGPGNDILRDTHRTNCYLGATMVGGPGDDTFREGTPDCATIHYGSSDAPVHIDRQEDVARGAGTDSLGGIANYTGSLYSDTFIGTDGADFFLGDDGDDFVMGHGGDDWFYGTNGDDYIDAGDGYDRTDGGAGNDSCLNAEYRFDCETI